MEFVTMVSDIFGRFIYVCHVPETRVAPIVKNERVLSGIHHHLSTECNGHRRIIADHVNKTILHVLGRLQTYVADHGTAMYRFPFHIRTVEQFPFIDAHVRVGDSVRDETFAADLAGISLRTIGRTTFPNDVRRSAAGTPSRPGR